MYEPIYSYKNVEIQIPIKGTQKGTFSNKFNDCVLQNKRSLYKPGEYWNALIQNELLMYTGKMQELLIGLMTHEFDSDYSPDYNPMFLKYMSDESGHWKVKSHFIWQFLEESIGKDINFIQLIN